MIKQIITIVILISNIFLANSLANQHSKDVVKSNYINKKQPVFLILSQKVADSNRLLERYLKPNLKTEIFYLNSYLDIYEKRKSFLMIIKNCLLMILL